MVLGAFWLDGVAVIGALPTGLPVPSLALPSLDFLLTAIEPALLIALIGSIYSLMISLMADSITGAQHNPNRELVGQGIGNMAAGILGAMPGAANPGTLINLQFGGRTVVAGVVAAACLLALLMGLGSYAEPIPLAALSAFLIRVGWSLIDWRFLVRLRQMQRGYAAVMLLTLALTAFVDPSDGGCVRARDGGHRPRRAAGEAGAGQRNLGAASGPDLPCRQRR